MVPGYLVQKEPLRVVCLPQANSGSCPGGQGRQVQDRIPAFPPIWEEKGTSVAELCISSPDLAHSSNKVMCQCGAAQVQELRQDSQSSLCCHTPTRRRWTALGIFSPCHIPERSTFRIQSNLGLSSWQKKAREWVSSQARTEEGPSDPSQREA